MELWEITWKHDKDHIDSHLKSQGRPPTKDMGKGIIGTYPKNLFMKFNGSKFWPIFKSKGHDSCDPSKCKCFRKN